MPLFYRDRGGFYFWSGHIGNGGVGGGMYSACGKVNTQAYSLASTSGLSCSDKHKNQVPSISATQLKNCDDV